MSDEDVTENENTKHEQDSKNSTKKQQLVDMVLSYLIESSVMQTSNGNLSIPNSSRRPLSDPENFVCKKSHPHISHLSLKTDGKFLYRCSTESNIINQEKIESDEEILVNNITDTPGIASSLKYISEHTFKSSTDSANTVFSKTSDFSSSNNILKEDPKVIADSNNVNNREKDENHIVDSENNVQINSMKNNISTESDNPSHISSTLSVEESITYILPHASSSMNIPVSLTKKIYEKEKKLKFINSFNDISNKTKLTDVNLDNETVLDEIECISLIKSAENSSVSSNKNYTFADVRDNSINVAVAGSSKECSSVNNMVEENEITTSILPDLWSTFNMERIMGLPDIFPRIDEQISSCFLRSTLINMEEVHHEITETTTLNTRNVPPFGLLPEDVPHTEGGELPFNIPLVNIENVGIERLQEHHPVDITVISANTQMYHELSPNLTEIVAIPQNPLLEEPLSTVRQRRDMDTVSNIYEYERTTAIYSSPNFRESQDSNEGNVQQERFRPFYSMDEIIKNAKRPRK